MTQVIAPTDVLKLAMVAGFYLYGGLDDQSCALSWWLQTLWKVLIFELGYKLMIQACVTATVLASFLVYLVLICETCWNLYGLYLFFANQDSIRCRWETLLCFKIALGLYIASNISAVLLVLCRSPEKPHIAEPPGLRSLTPERTKLNKPHSN